MPLEAVIGQDPPEIWVISEEDAEHVPDLSLVPVGSSKHLVRWTNWCQFVCVGFDTDARVETQRQQVVYNLQ